MVKRGEIKNISKVLEDVISQKHFKVGIDNLRVQEAWVKTMGENIQKYTYNVKSVSYTHLTLPTTERV